MKIDIQIKFDPYQRLNEKYREYALKDAERQMAEKLYEALEPYIKKEVDSEHVRLTLDGIEGEDLGFRNYDLQYNKYVKFNQPDEGDEQDIQH